ncbi:MAG: hypothetical protein JSV00_07085, partial [bacterium]
MTRLMLVVLTMGVAVTASGCAGTAKRAGTLHTLSGTTRFQGRPLVSGEVTAMRAEPGGTVLRAPIGADGGFRIGLPPGSYLLMAQGRDPASGSALFSFLANNPVHVYRDMPDAVVLPFVASTAPPRPAAGGGISGTVLLDGEPVSGAVV